MSSSNHDTLSVSASPAPRLSPFPQEILERILGHADQRTCVTCVRVNSAFYDACIRQVYTIVKMFPKSRTVALPLSGQHATTLANYVWLLDISGDLNGSCIAAVRYPPPMPNRRTIRLCAAVSPRLVKVNDSVWGGITQLRPHTLVTRDRAGAPNVSRVPGGPYPWFFKHGTTVASVLQVCKFVCVLDEGLSFSDSTLCFLSHDMPVRSLESFTFVFWTKSRNQPWHWSARNPGGPGNWYPMFQVLIDLLLCQPATEGRPLLTIVNAGAIPHLGFIGIPSVGGIPSETLTSQQRATKFETDLKGGFNYTCDYYEAGRQHMFAGGWHASIRDRQHHIRSLTMDEFLAEDNGEAFDEGELAGWR
ncbi:uncharacterized protein LOC62_05G007302 [Vanrija pseudolonga]|uniref:F-box domain-containing protein n=1 Tax=Vanrija pseudolonga TaxID=143232 RepID=A0AAF0YF37_9TREE|nr:hypothetical protein LOC62_05G007302 [Vanrija pseudolonga]